MAPSRWGIVALALSLLWLQLTAAVPQSAKVPRIGVL
jgi:hypothetical protein